ENGNAERRAKKSEAYQIDPKRMRGNPAWNEGRNTHRGGEMFGTKNSHRNRKKESAKRHDLVDAMFLRQFLENLDQADNENQRRTNIDPKCRRRNAKGRGGQSKYDASGHHHGGSMPDAFSAENHSILRRLKCPGRESNPIRRG